MARAGASSKAKAFSGVPVAPRGQNRSFKSPAFKFKQARPQEPLDMDDEDDEYDDISDPPEQERKLLPILMIPQPVKKGLGQTFWNANARGLRVPPLSPEQSYPRPNRKMDRKPSILFMQNARRSVQIANHSKAPGKNGFTAARGGMSAGKGGGPSGSSAGGPR